MKIEKTLRTKFYTFDGVKIATISNPFGKYAHLAYWAENKLFTIRVDRREFAQNLREARKNRRDAANDHRL